MYISLDKAFLEKNKAKAIEASINMSGKEGNDTLLFEETTDSIEELDIKEDSIEVIVSNELGYFSLEIPLDTSDWETLLGIVIKRMNKMKTLLETLK